MANEQPKWKNINMGDILPCQSFLRKKDGEILKLSTVGGVKVGQDCYYLPVDEVINVIKDYPVEESEDERIIKDIVEAVELHKDFTQERKEHIYAWLEKQGYQSPKNTNKECLKGIKRVQEYQDLSDWEKKFDNIASMYAHNKNQEGYNESWYVKERAAAMLYHAKKELEKQGEPKEINPSEFDLQLNRLLKQFKPLPKEELASSLSFYLNVVHNDGTYKEEKQGEQKPIEWIRELEEKLSNATPEQLAEWKEKYFKEEYAEWSEEDEKISKRVETAIDSYYAPFSRDAEEMQEWLKALKNRVQPQSKQEWSNEDERIYRSIIYSFAHNFPLTVQQQVFVKSFKERYAWKPSEEQMKYLAKAITTLGNEGDNKTSAILYELRTDLKKLKE